MSKHETNQKDLSHKQFALLIGHIVTAATEVSAPYFVALSADEAKAYLSSISARMAEFKNLMRPMFANADPYSAQRAYWGKIYAHYYHDSADFSLAIIPPKPVEGKWRLIGVAKGLTMNYAAAVYKKIIVAHDARWSFWKYADDLDGTVTDNVRTSSESYFVWVRDGLEPDEKYLGKSTRAADPDKKIGVTLLERLVHGAVHFVETKKHLDEVGVTLCTGSRRSDGRVPYVGWGPGSREVYVFWCSIGYAFPWHGLREAVS